MLQCVSPAVSLRSDIVSFSALRDKGHACDSSIIVRQRTKLFVLLLVFGLGLMTERSWCSSFQQTDEDSPPTLTHTHTHWEGLFLDSDMTALTAVIIMGTWGGGGRTHSVCFLCQAETFDFSPVNLYNPRTCQLWTLNSRERQKKKKTPSSLVYWAQAIMMSSCQSFTPFEFQGRRLELHIQLSSLRTLITFYQSTALICPHTLI